jgi:transposase
MWTTENRARYDHNYLRYPSDLTDAEWALIEPRLPPAKPGGNKRTVNLREIANGLMYILSTGCQWRAIPKDLPPRSTLYDYFDQRALLYATASRSAFEIGPVVQAWALGAVAGRQSPPSALGKVLRDLGGGAANKRLHAPGPEHVIGGNAQDIPFARLAQHGLDISRAIHAVRRHKGKWYLCGERSRDHSAGNLRLRRKPHIVRHTRRLQAIGIVHPLLWQIKGTIDKGLAVARHVTSKHANLAVGDLARRARVLACYPARFLALLQETGLINDKNRRLVGKRFQRVRADDIAQCIGVPPAAAQDRLLTPRPAIARRFRPHPTCLSWLAPKKSVQKLSSRYCNTLLAEQRTYPRLHIPQR